MQGRIFYIICGYSSGKSLSFYPVNLTNWEKLSFFGHFYPGRVYDFLENIRPCLNVRLDVNLTYCLGNFVPVMLSTNPSCCTAKRLNSPLGKNKEKRRQAYLRHFPQSCLCPLLKMSSQLQIILCSLNGQRKGLTI